MGRRLSARTGWRPRPPSDAWRVLQSELSAEQVAEWADAIEVRDDVGFESDQVREALHVLANPALEGALDPAKAAAIRDRLVYPRHPCACCGYLTMLVPPGDGSYEICPVCFWEDDGVQWRDPDYAGGANKPSLREARRNFEECGANHLDETSSVRAPRPDEEPRQTWD